MRTLLICHDGAVLDQEGLARWLASFSELAGVVVIQEKPGRKWQRIRREIRRSGVLGFADVLAFRLYYRLLLARRDSRWERERIETLRRDYRGIRSDTPVLRTASPNSAECEKFIRDARPDIVIARCKTLLKEEVFSIPARGTLVMHPGVCPEYRNAHGCFWALTNGDLQKVGMTLLRIDKGVDTGPVYGYYSYPFDEVRESHMVIQHRVVHENLAALEAKLREICEGAAVPLDTAGRRSGAWGQPWLSCYLRWKLQARRRARSEAVTLLYHDVVRDGQLGSSGFDGADADRYKLDASEFERHLGAIAAAAKNQPGSVLKWLESGSPRAPLFLTFDDGGASASERIGEALAKRGWVGHFLVTTGRIGTPGFINEEQIRALRAQGHVVGSHSLSHPLRMSSCSKDELLREWRESCARLQDILGEPITVASVPGGYFSRRVADAACETGIRVLFTSEPTARVARVGNCRVLGRYSVIRDTPASAVTGLIAGRAAFRARQKLLWDLKKLIKRLGGEHYISARKTILRRRQGR